MSSGFSDRFHILQHSPLDAPEVDTAVASPGAESEEASVSTTTSRWMPSRYTLRSTTDDGRLVIWNTLRGSISVFPAAKAEAVKGLLHPRGFEAEPNGLVGYLTERGFLVEDGSREYSRLQLAFGEQHYRTDNLQLVLLASEDCNFRCKYCYEEFARGTMQPWVRNGVKELIRGRLPGLRALNISWFGGEPLYGFPAIADLGPFFVETAEEHGLDFTSNITTNGYLLTPKIAAKLLAWKVSRYQITLDGPAETHDLSRPARDGSGTFRTIFDNLRALAARPEDFRVDIRVNFDRENYPRIEQLLDRLAGEFQNDQRFWFRFRAVCRWGGPNDDALNVLGVDSEQAKQTLEDEASARGLHLADRLHEIQGFGAQTCHAARPYNFVIGAGGSVMKCTVELYKSERNILGRLTEDGKLDLDKDKLALWTQPAFETDEKCKKCVVLPICQGANCPLVRLRTGDAPCAPLRTSFKKELRDMVTTVGNRARTARVAATPERPSPPSELVAAKADRPPALVGSA